MIAKYTLKRTITNAVALIFFWSNASAQLSAVNTTATGAGSNQDGFQYNGYFLPEYSLGWYYPQGPGVTPSIPPTAYFSSFNGFQFFTATQVRFVLDYNGNVGIGTTSPDAKLTVSGTVHSKEVKVDTNIPVPDYVFAPSYKLPALKEVGTFVATNHHLPEIPSAGQIAREGLNLGEMNLKLLKKVEELTLYLIEKDKQLDREKQERISEQNHLKAALSKLERKLSGSKTR